MIQWAPDSCIFPRKCNIEKLLNSLTWRYLVFLTNSNFRSSYYLVFVVKAPIYPGSSPLPLEEVLQSDLRGLSQAYIIRMFKQIKHNSQLYGCPFFPQWAQTSCWEQLRLSESFTGLGLRLKLTSLLVELLQMSSGFWTKASGPHHLSSPSRPHGACKLFFSRVSDWRCGENRQGSDWDEAAVSSGTWTWSHTACCCPGLPRPSLVRAGWGPGRERIQAVNPRCWAHWCVWETNCQGLIWIQVVPQPTWSPVCVWK